MFNLPKKVLQEIKDSPKGVIPNSLRSAVSKAGVGKEYLGTEGTRVGTKYRKFGPVSVMTGKSTPETKAKARATVRAKRAAKRPARRPTR